MTPERPSPAIAGEILTEFGISSGEVVSVEAFGGGFANWSYRVVRSGGEEYVLTYCANKSPAEVEVLVSVLQGVAEAGVATNRLIPGGSGGVVAEWRGVPVILKELLPGGGLAAPDPGLARRAGRELGALGAVAPPPGLPATHAYGLELVDDLSPAEREGPGAWYVEQAASLRVRRPPTGREGLVHGDLFPDNMVVGPGGAIALIDFEEACRERLMLDVGMACVGLVAAFGPLEELLEAFVAGYRERQPELAPELRELPYYMEVAATMTALWRYRERVRTGPAARASDPADMVAIADSLRREEGDLAAFAKEWACGQ